MEGSLRIAKERVIIRNIRQSMFWKTNSMQSSVLMRKIQLLFDKIEIEFEPRD